MNDTEVLQRIFLMLMKFDKDSRTTRFCKGKATTCLGLVAGCGMRLQSRSWGEKVGPCAPPGCSLWGRLHFPLFSSWELLDAAFCLMLSFTPSSLGFLHSSLVLRVRLTASRSSVFYPHGCILYEMEL